MGTMAEESSTSSDGGVDQPSTLKMVARGLASNTIAAVILASIGWSLDLWRFVAVALGLQLLVFVAHGLPQRSEKFYDLSGSFTHLAVVLTALMSETKVRGPRQLFAAVVSVVWMTRLGTFLYSRILRDGKDGRFDELKPVWVSFLGAWTIQAVWVLLIQLPVVLLNARDDSSRLGPIDAVLMLAWFVGFLCEAAADSQKMVFRDNPENKSR